MTSRKLRSRDFNRGAAGGHAGSTAMAALPAWSLDNSNGAQHSPHGPLLSIWSWVWSWDLTKQNFSVIYENVSACTETTYEAYNVPY